MNRSNSRTNSNTGNKNRKLSDAEKAVVDQHRKKKNALL